MLFLKLIRISVSRSVYQSKVSRLLYLQMTMLTIWAFLCFTAPVNSSEWVTYHCPSPSHAKTNRTALFLLSTVQDNAYVHSFTL